MESESENLTAVEEYSKDLGEKSKKFPLTKQFLEIAFEREVEKFIVNLGSKPGDNYLSTIYAIDVTFKGEDDAKYYVVKFSPEDIERRTFVEETTVFEKELFFYQDMLPKLNQVVKESGADGKSVGLCSAPFHGGNIGFSPSPKWRGSEWATATFIIMTDLRKSKFVMKDRFQGLDMEHATVATKEMAKWHALVWAYKERNGWSRLSDEYPNLVDQTYSDKDWNVKLKGYYDQIHDMILHFAEGTLGKEHPVPVAFKRVMDADVIKIKRKFLEPQGVPEEDYEDMFRVRPEEDTDYCKEPWLTGTHGDCWVNNMLFRHDSTGVPVQVAFIDLQYFREACPTIDLAQFLYSSVRAPIRILGKEQFLLAYHDVFLASCKELKVQPYPGFSVGSLKKRYRRSELFGLLVSIPSLVYSLRPPVEGNVAEDKEKNLDADMGIYKNQKFLEEIVQALVDLYENGVI